MQIPRSLLIIGLLPVLIMSLACQEKGGAPEATELLPGSGGVVHPEWSYDRSIYEVNVRQYTPEGTFRAFAEHLPRLKNLGVGILWFMPIQPTGEKNRKGTLGSYYSIKEYRAVNPNYGTLEDFKWLVGRAHDLGFYVILDWVANHTAWDNPLTASHPDWYTLDENGGFVPPVADWSDVIDLNYENRDLWRYMIDAMKYWIEEADIDGFRCDVAEMIPLEFWETARAELDMIKPVFMLAEGTGPRLHDRAFDMTYDWGLHHLMKSIAQGEHTAAAIDSHLAREAAMFPRNAFRMQFTSNHDENAWAGTVFERLGPGAEAFAVLTATIPGMPLVYSGQEAGLDKRLQFFEKDPIPWKTHEMAGLYSKLLNLKKRNRALRNGDRGGPFVRVHTSNDGAVFAFVRKKGRDGVFAVLNLSPTRQRVLLRGPAYIGDYRDVITGDAMEFSEGAVLELGAWGYGVWSR